jgi:rare lipoprotein A
LNYPRSSFLLPRSSKIRKNCRLLLLTGLSIIIYHLSFSPAGAQTQSGKASYYARNFNGRRTASGERLHRDSLTCAHRSYPFGTRLLVTNVLNGQQVVVRVNDRGPFRKERIIDLSWAAAKAIGMIAQGIAPVTVERLEDFDIPFRPEEQTLPQLELDIADVKEDTDSATVAKWRR